MIDSLKNHCSVHRLCASHTAGRNWLVKYLIQRYVEFVPLRGRPPGSEHDQEEVVNLPEGDLGSHLAEEGGEDEGDDGED